MTNEVNSFTDYQINTKPNRTQAFHDKGEIVECPKGTFVFTHSETGCKTCDERILDAPYVEGVVHCNLQKSNSTAELLEIARERLKKLK